MPLEKVTCERVVSRVERRMGGFPKSSSSKERSSNLEERVPLGLRPTHQTRKHFHSPIRPLSPAYSFKLAQSPTKMQVRIGYCTLYPRGSQEVESSAVVAASERGSRCAHKAVKPRTGESQAERTRFGKNAHDKPQTYGLGLAAGWLR